MQEFSLSTTIQSTPDRIWPVLTDFTNYTHWNTIIPSASGSAVPGTRLDFKIIQPDGRNKTFLPTVIKVSPNYELVLAAVVLHKSLVHMSHYFTLEPKGQTETVLVQRWVVTGILVPLLWSRLTRSMARYSKLGEDLRSAVESEAGLKRTP